MNNYTTYCSGDQTKKALELGAPIQYASIIDIRLSRFVNADNECYVLPTLEQMIEWLEEQGIWEISISRMWDGWSFHIYISWGDDIVFKEEIYPSRKEATLAAIDKALEYLVDNNLKK